MVSAIPIPRRNKRAAGVGYNIPRNSRADAEDVTTRISEGELPSRHVNRWVIKVWENQVIMNAVEVEWPEQVRIGRAVLVLYKRKKADPHPAIVTRRAPGYSISRNCVTLRIDQVTRPLEKANQTRAVSLQFDRCQKVRRRDTENPGEFVIRKRKIDRQILAIQQSAVEPIEGRRRSLRSDGVRAVPD